MKTKKLLNGVICIMLATVLGASVGCTPKEKTPAKKGEKIVFASVEDVVSSESATVKESWVTETSTSLVAGTEGSPAVTEWEYKLIKGDFCLIKNGDVKCSILYDQNCDAKVYSAAWDLADNLKAMTGKDFPVIELTEDTPPVEGNKILIGENSYTKKLGIKVPSGYPDNEGYVIVSSLNIMVLAGNDESYYNGTAFAVTAFLESLGFGWFANDELWNVVPKADTVYAPCCDILSRPSYPTRYNRVLVGDESSNPIIAKRWFLGGEPSEVDHKFTTFFSATDYGTTNDVFALVNGVRSIEGLKWWQCCLSNPDVQNRVIDCVREFFRENPEYTGVSIGQNDGNGGKGDPDYGNFCECADCAKMGNCFTVQLVKFANIVARAIKDEFPDKTLMIYAYVCTFNAPTPEQLGEKIEDNVLITICHQGGTTRTIRKGNSFDETRNLTVAKSTAMLYTDGTMARTADFMENYLNWKALGGQQALYEWNCAGAYGDNEWRYRFWLPGKAFIDNARWLKEQGCRYIYIDQGPNGDYESNEFDCFELRWPMWYVSAKAMWNCNQSFEDIMMSACKRLYGDAAETMYEFYETLTNANDNCDVFCFEWALPSGAEMYGSCVKEIDAIMNRARKQGAEIGGDIQERIENQYSYWTMTKAHSGL